MIQFIILCLLNVLSSSFPSGAPLRHCGDMIPGHNADPLDTHAPFYLSASLNDLSSLIVKIESESGYHFKGFLIEARSDINLEEALGEWTTHERHTKSLDCFDNKDSAITHYFKDDKIENSNSIQDGPHFTHLNFKWKHSNISNLKRIYFVATVVKKYKQFYTNITLEVNMSEIIKKFHLV